MSTENERDASAGGEPSEWETKMCECGARWKIKGKAVPPRTLDAGASAGGEVEEALGRFAGYLSTQPDIWPGDREVYPLIEALARFVELDRARREPSERVGDATAAPNERNADVVDPFEMWSTDKLCTHLNHIAIEQDDANAGAIILAASHRLRARREPSGPFPDGEAWIGVDLDGTLARYDGWVSPSHIGEPIPAILARVKGWRAAGRNVAIFTARISQESQRAEATAAIERWCLEHVGEVLPITNRKNYGMVECWDDRATQVVRNDGTPFLDPSDGGSAGGEVEEALDPLFAMAFNAGYERGLSRESPPFTTWLGDNRERVRTALRAASAGGEPSEWETKMCECGARWKIKGKAVPPRTLDAGASAGGEVEEALRNHVAQALYSAEAREITKEWSAPDMLLVRDSYLRQADLVLSVPTIRAALRARREPSEEVERLVERAALMGAQALVRKHGLNFGADDGVALAKRVRRHLLARAASQEGEE